MLSRCARGRTSPRRDARYFLGASTACWEASVPVEERENGMGENADRQICSNFAGDVDFRVSVRWNRLLLESVIRWSYEGARIRYCLMHRGNGFDHVSVSKIDHRLEYKKLPRCLWQNADDTVLIFLIATYVYYISIIHYLFQS